MAQEWLWMPAAQIGRGIADGSIDPVQLATVFLEAIECHPDGSRIYARTTPGRALAEAEAAKNRAKSGRRLSPLDGVPASWKDLFDTAGVQTEGGSALLSGRIPTTDAHVLKTATAAGLVCLGKTHMSELAFSGLGLNPITATPPCVNDPNGVPGGSSSGAAASVAFGLAPLAIGTDTGGSVRIPSIWNDLVGLKTTAGHLSLDGVLPLAPNFDTVGPLCRTVEDAALAFGVLEGQTPTDLTGPSVSGLRLAILETVAMDDVRDQPHAGFQSAVERLQASGAIMKRIRSTAVADAIELQAILFATEAYATWRTEIEAAPDKMYSEILDRFRGGAAFGGADYVRAWQSLRKLRKAWAHDSAAFDAVILPGAPNMPPDAQRLLADSDYYTSENLLALRNTRIANLLGLAALALPTGLPSTGIMFMGPPHSERKLLRIGAAAEAALA